MGRDRFPAEPVDTGSCDGTAGTGSSMGGAPVTDSMSTGVVSSGSDDTMECGFVGKS